ncbi:hypothetical protein KEM54_000625 [Ascosphaera aggregata]|nr:hypothetical protein KEM54_000625 [Ascosphaera aggregata]
MHCFSCPSKARETAKARQHLDLLESARCNGNWVDIPEILRKVTKHAPERKCVIQTAAAERKLAVYAACPSDHSRQSLLELVPSLLSAIGEQTTTRQEAFQAQICLGRLHQVASEPELALSRIPDDFVATVQSLTTDGSALAPYTEVSIVEGAYVKVTAQEQVSGPDAALTLLKSILPHINSRIVKHSSTPQYLFWSEKLCSKAATLSSLFVVPQGASVREEDVEYCLQAFRSWASHSEVKRQDPLTDAPTSLSESTQSMAATWKAYYDVLTAILQKKLPYIAPFDGPPAVQLSAEFRRVQGITEVIFLANTKFPKANEGNDYVEAFVEQVIGNWEILCGPEWHAEDFGDGGQDALSRSVLELLYRAASKTFHSLVILRRLFHVHSSLAEFFLAMKAYDTYITLHTRAKAKAQKHPEMDSTESTEDFARTVSEGVLILCCFGTRDHARKIKGLVGLLEKQLEDLISSGATLGCISLTYRAIGIGLATWARWTPENEERADIQASALAALEKAASIDTDGVTDLAAAYALGILKAETRDINGAIDCVRTALVKSKPADEDDFSNYNKVMASRERDTVPLWHLFALLLSAKGDFDASHRACVAGLDDVETFSSDISRQVWGDFEIQSTISNPEPLRNALHEVEAREKESIIELRLTQLSLIEVLYGPEAALNHSDQLLKLFGRLFSQHDVRVTSTKTKAHTSPQPQQHLAPPSVPEKPRACSSRGSIFSRRKASRKADDGHVDHHHHHLSFRHSNLTSVNVDASHTLEDHTNSNGLVEEILQANRASQERNLTETKLGNGDLTAAVNDGGTVGSSMPIPEPTRNNIPIENQPLAAAARGANIDDMPIPGKNAGRWPNPSVSPTGALITLTKVQLQKHVCCVLAKIWIFVAGLFRRAELYDEAREACNEAFEQASRLESLVATQDASAKGFADANWGLSKSADELWADVYAERGLLAQAEGLFKDALSNYEEAVQYSPYHLAGIIGLCNLLLDIYDEKFPIDDEDEEETVAVRGGELRETSLKALEERPTIKVPEPYRKEYPTDEPPPKLTIRLAARDRAFMLLSMLTKTGHAWDSSEAWYLLSRAYEQTDDIGKTRELLWWCIELEDKKPIRHWSNLGPSTYVL